MSHARVNPTNGGTAGPPSRALFVQSLDDDALKLASQHGFATVVESRGDTPYASLTGMDVLGAGASAHVMDEAIWQAAPRICRRLAEPLSTSPATRTCIRQIWLAEVIAPLLAGYSEGLETRDSVTPGRGDTALIEPGVGGQAFAAALGLPVLSPHRGEAATRRSRKTLGSMPRPLDVLFVELFAYRLVNLSGVAKELRRRGHRVGLLSLARSPDEEMAHRFWASSHGVEMHSWRWWATAAAGPVAVQAARMAPALLRQRMTVPRELEMFFGTPLDGEIHRIARRALVERALKALATHGLFESALRHLKPRAVFTCRGDGPTLRALSLAGHAAGVPVVDVQHGRQNLLPPAGVAEIERAHFAFASDHAGVVYRAQGVPADHIHLVGSVGFDAVMRGRDEATPYPFRFSVFSSCAATSTNVDQWNEATRVAAGAAPPAVQHAYALGALDRFLNANPDDRVVVVLHPREDGTRTRDLVGALTNSDRFIVLDRANNGPLFAHARFHLSLGSTTSLEATLVGTPAVVIEPLGHESYFDRAIELGAMQRVSRLSELDDALTRASTARFEQSEVVRSYAVSNDFKTVERLLEIPPLHGHL